MKEIILLLVFAWLVIKYFIHLFDVFGYQYEMKMRKRFPHATPQPRKPIFQIFKK